MKHTISILVQNHAGVLSRISGLFSRRGFNIDSLAVGVTDDPLVSRITVVADGDEQTIDQIEKQLSKLLDVIVLKRLPTEQTILRELMLIKVACDASTRSDIMDIAKAMSANICDISKTTITIEVADVASRLEIVMELLAPFNILEVARTGTIALEKGAEVLNLSNV